MFLAQELKKITNLYVTEIPARRTLNPIFKTLGYTIGHTNDLVHVQFEYGIFPSLKLGRRTLTAFAALPFYLGLSLGNRRVVTTIHEPRKTVITGGKSGLAYIRLLDQLIFSVSDLIIVHTQESRQLLQTLYSVEGSKLRVIAHGSYEQPKFMDRQEAKAEFGLMGKIVVTILGFVTPKKGHDLVIPLLSKLDRNVQLVIAVDPKTLKMQNTSRNSRKWLQNTAMQIG
jgi:glycosyltransferase involved in cell wall biosynthesis